jgi:hypothetical protein
MYNCSAGGLQDIGGQEGGSGYESLERSPPLADFIVQEEDVEEAGEADGSARPRSAESLSF